MTSDNPTKTAIFDGDNDEAIIELIGPLGSTHCRYGPTAPISPGC